jgi:hypothetical protein
MKFIDYINSEKTPEVEIEWKKQQIKNIQNSKFQEWQKKGMIKMLEDEIKELVDILDKEVK